MNKMFRVIWSKAKEKWVAVSEMVSAKGSCPLASVGTICLAALLVTGSPAFALDSTALPTGGTITSGSGSITSSGSQMTVNQVSQKIVANWETFNIGTEAGVTFNQPNSSATALNRIQDQNPSQILGSLSSNGQVFLVNPSGIIFGSSAQVNVGGLVASSLYIADEDFLNGNYSFANNGTAGSISNAGTINAANGGYVAFLSPVISNEGTVTADGGTVAMAAGDKVNLDFSGDGLISFTVDQGAVDAQIENSGLIRADGGAVLLTAEAADELTSAVVNNSGVIEAGSLVEKNGRIVLTADGDSGELRISGTLDVSGTEPGATGGTVIATGHEVTLDGGATIDASGSAGGGEVYVGGGWQGNDETIANAAYVTADESVKVVADALDNGDGGTVVFWSDDRTAFAGNISVRGGNSGGDGGAVEVSGKHKLAYTGLTDARAPHGSTGDLLLDPDTIQILDGGTGVGLITGDTVYEADLEAQMANITLTSSLGSVILQDLTTDGVLQLQNNVSLTINSADDFIAADPNDEIRLSGTGALAVDTGSAGGQVSSCKITTETGSVRLWGDDGLTVGNTITTGGGSVNLWGDSDNGGAGVLYINYGITTAGGDVDLDAGGSGVYVNADVSTGAGRLYFDREGSVMGATYRLSAKLSSTGDVDVNQTLQFGTGAEIETTGTITFSGFSSMQNSGASLTLTAAAFDFQQNLTGNSGSITLKPNLTGTNVDIGSAGTGDMTITNANLARLVNFSNITIGREDGTGTTTVVSDSSAAAAGNFTLVNDTINVTGGTIANTAGDVVLSANTLNLSQTVTADSGNGSVTIQQATAANALDIGSDVTNTTTGNVNAGTLIVGRADGGAVTVSQDITTTVDTVHIKSESTVTATAGSIQCSNLAVTAGGGATISDTDFEFTNLALNVGGDTTVTRAADLSISSIDGVNGIVLDNAGAATLAINATGADTGITVAAPITKSGVGTATLSLDATGDITQNDNVDVIATGAAMDVLYDGGSGSNDGFVDIGEGADINTNGGDLTINSSLGITCGSNSAIVANAAALTAGGTTDDITLNSSNINLASLKASNARNITVVDSNTLALGAISAAGKIDIATLVGNLTVADDITTSDTTANAIMLNAGRSSAAGAAGSGEMIVSGSPSISTGSGGRVTMYTGTVSGSTGLTALVGSGSGRFRYNSDESDTNYTTALGSGMYAVYREQPTLTVTADDAGFTYGSPSTLTTTIVGMQNGDTEAVAGTGITVGVSGATSSSGNYTAGTHTLTPSGASGLGYGSTHVTGTLTVSKRSLTLGAGAVQDKVYDGTTDATFSSNPFSGLVAGDDVRLDGAASVAFDDPDVGFGKPVTITGFAVNGADTANYTATVGVGHTADILPFLLPYIPNTAPDAPVTPGSNPGNSSPDLINLTGAWVQGIADTGTSRLIDQPFETGGTMTLATNTSISALSFERSGHTVTLTTGAGQNGESMMEVGLLPVFTKGADGSVKSQGGYMVNEGASVISLTEVYSVEDVGLDETGLDNARSVSFSLSLSDGTTRDLTAALTENGVLVISGAEGVTGLDMDQTVLTGLQTLKQEMNINLGEIRAVLVNTEKERAGLSV